jgi:predicted transcriptional regulator
MGEGTRDLRAVAALGEPARRTLYAYVAAQDRPVSRDEAAGATGMKRPTAAFHLDRLVADGLLEVAFARLSGRTGPGAGRTAKLYARSGRQFAVSLPPRRYELAGEVLAILQAAGEPLSPAAVRERLGGDLAYTTVVTILSRLHAKGVLERQRDGRAYRYTPVADEPGLAARRMASVLAAEADREAVLARFVSGLSGEDEQALRRMLGPDGADGG